MTAAPLLPVFQGLEPAPVWAHFADLCRIPRPSKGETAIRAHLQAWAQGQGFETRVDEAGNLLIRKPATPGCAHFPGMVLQGHLDMVCQKNNASAHDFNHDPIQPVLADGWLKAPETTLGADNGLGVALALAALEDPTLAHGPLEVLLTVDEEAGMGGARGLAPDLLQGRLMLNLDTEEWGEFYMGCAGGLDVTVDRPGEPQPLPAGHEVWRITLGGLRGGHSGVNIHEERGNAIKLLLRVLVELGHELPLHLVALEGGTARNALPREAWAELALPVGHGAWLAARLEALQDCLASELKGIETGLSLQAELTQKQTQNQAQNQPQAARILAPAEQALWLASLHAAPHGVRRWSRAVPGVVECSNNLGMVRLGPEAGHCNFMIRSLSDTSGPALADEIVSLFALSGTRALKGDAYPGWAPNPDSPLLALAQGVFAERFGEASSVQVIHAGLECGIIGATYPGMDMVSFGPTIRGAHAPGEGVEVASVGRCYTLLKAILEGVGRLG